MAARQARRRSGLVKTWVDPGSAVNSHALFSRKAGSANLWWPPIEKTGRCVVPAHGFFETEKTLIPHSDFHEVWWIYSPINGKEWAGLRIAHFRKTVNGELVVVITGEIDQRRTGLRVWDDIREREEWFKVRQIPIPTMIEMLAAAIPDED